MHSLRRVIDLSLLFFLFFIAFGTEDAGDNIEGSAGSKLFSESFGVFNEPWAMTFLPNGDLQYSGVSIPDHDTRPEFHTPELYWVPTVAPSGLIIYEGKMFPEWQGNAFIGGLRSKSLLRISIVGDQAEEAERFAMGKRIREVEQGPDGAIWVLEDKK